MCENYLILNHKVDILGILKHQDKDKRFSININFLELFESDTNLGNSLLTDPESSLKSWNEAVLTVQDTLIKEVDTKSKVKYNVTCRIYSLPPWPHVCRAIFPGNDDADKFLQVSGTVTRMSVRKLLEYQRQYVCVKCKYVIMVDANYDKKYIIKQPKKCTNPEGCTSKNIITFGELDPYNCKDYQEIKIQEDLSKMGAGTVPDTLLVTLEDDLVNVCKPGENVTITGIVKRRWSEFSKGAKIEVDIVLRANHVQVNNRSGLSLSVSEEMRHFFDSFWETHKHEPLVGRNVILKSIAPELYGLHLVKLAIAIVLAGGSQNIQNQTSTGIDTRSESHLLLVGDPGTGKSQLLRFASKLIPRSVLTTGIGSTAAGLTVTAIMENGEWQLEAGALVMSDGGICCIDEFNSMREHDRTSIHEAMEQQTISVAKAGIVCKLKTRCTILAACNPKGNIDPVQPLCMNVAMSSPLLSRFDLLLLIRDTVNEENDLRLAEYLLNGGYKIGSGGDGGWSLEKLQAYYIIIKELNPKLTSDAETILSTYYQLQRKLTSRNKSRTTVRLLESLIRLSQGHAKLMFHREVEVIDTIFAIILADAALDYESSLLKLKVDNSSFSENPEEFYRELSETILGKLNLDYILQKEIDKTLMKSSHNVTSSGSRQFENISQNSNNWFTKNNDRSSGSCSQNTSQTNENITDFETSISQNNVRASSKILSQTNREDGGRNGSHSFGIGRQSVTKTNYVNINQSISHCSQNISQRNISDVIRNISHENSAKKTMTNLRYQSLMNLDMSLLDMDLDMSYVGNAGSKNKENNDNFVIKHNDDKSNKFSIFQGKNNLFLGNRVPVNFEKTSTSKDNEWSKKTKQLSDGEVNILNSNENLPNRGSLLKKSFINESGLDVDIPLKAIREKCDKSDRSKINDDIQNLLSDQLEVNLESVVGLKDKYSKGFNLNPRKKGCDKNVKEKRKLGHPVITDTKTETNCDQKRRMNEMDLLKMMPSVNDHFMDFDLEFDGELTQNSKTNLDKSAKIDFNSCTKEVDLNEKFKESGETQMISISKNKIGSHELDFLDINKRTSPKNCNKNLGRIIKKYVKTTQSNNCFSSLDDDINNFTVDANFQIPLVTTDSKFGFKSTRNSKTSNNIGENNPLNELAPKKSNFIIENLDLDNQNLSQNTLREKSINNSQSSSESNKKHKLFNLSQNSRTNFIRNKFGFKKVDVTKICRSDSLSSDSSA